MFSFWPRAKKSSSKGKCLLITLVTFVATLVTLSAPQCRFTYHSFANCWFSHDVTKIQTKKQPILPRFYFHYTLEQLKTKTKTNKFSLQKGFWFCVTEYAWISKLLRDSAFPWRPRLHFRKFCYLNSSCIRKSITLMFMTFSKNKFKLL